MVDSCHYFTVIYKRRLIAKLKRFNLLVIISKLEESAIMHLSRHHLNYYLANKKHPY